MKTSGIRLLSVRAARRTSRSVSAPGGQTSSDGLSAATAHTCSCHR
jgi:hypothetical protein